jgi:hypothetical protein
MMNTSSENTEAQYLVVILILVINNLATYLI